MTTTLPAPRSEAPLPVAPPEAPASDRGARLAQATVRWIAALGGAFLIFSALLISKNANPLTVYTDAWNSTFARQQSIEDIVIKMAPFVLAALAVVVPARAGMANVGGEGQVIIGAVAACGTAMAVGDALPGVTVMVLMMLAGMVAGAMWAGIAGAMRLLLKVNEAVTTLLLNYVALDVLLFLIYQPWRADPTGQPATKELQTAAKLPLLAGTTVNVGIVIAVIAVVLVWIALSFTTWGFSLSVVGGNAEAARRAGLPVAKLLLSALLVGGALAGLAGMVHFAGVEYKLRPGFGAQIGYTAFLASWLARHKPIPVLLACFVFAALTVAGDSLQLDAGLPAATVNILTGLILIAVLGWTTSTRKANS
ncbi:MAG: inner-rane translocator [Jatrophihabitantaceae bacterium]|nr:inner-rane translocator [Jatrophihabitantaceae bacterium]